MFIKYYYESSNAWVVQASNQIEADNLFKERYPNITVDKVERVLDVVHEVFR